MKQINIGLVGYQFMGKAHSNAYRQVNKFFQDMPVKPVLKAICGRNEERVKNAGENSDSSPMKPTTMPSLPAMTLT